MNILKYLTFSFFTICCLVQLSQAQTGQPLPINCNTNFWTITVDGYIQQWSLSNGTISGGDTILSGGGTSLSYCGNSIAPTFFSNSYAQVGIIYYDPGSGWINIPTYSVVNNNGGHLNDQYYMVEGAVIQVVKYWDGVNLVTVDSLKGSFFAGTQDIGVDTLGQAWVFTGPGPSIVDSLKVYNKNGMVNAYAIQFNQIAYGSFFLNDTLYLGTVQDSVFPVIISGSTAQLGNPIPFAAGSFTDMASCQVTPPTSISENTSTGIKLFPNPTRGYLSLPFDSKEAAISIYNAHGKLIRTKLSGQTIDLAGQPAGIYLLKVRHKGLTRFQKVIKL